MAGKHIGGDRNPSLITALPTDATAHLFIHHFQPKTVKAYAEGRLGVPAANPHEPGSEAAQAYANGALQAANPLTQFETAVP